MSDNQELQVREKKELKREGESTREGPFFTPDVDIYETDDGLVMVADVPGATDESIELDLRDNLLNLTANVQSVDDKWKPVYAEYQIGRYGREFRMGQIVDTEKIAAQVKDGVLTVHLPKVQKARARKISVAAER